MKVILSRSEMIQVNALMSIAASLFSLSIVEIRKNMGRVSRFQPIYGEVPRNLTEEYPLNKGASPMTYSLILGTGLKGFEPLTLWSVARCSIH